MILVSNVKAIQITLSHSVLESIFGLKFINIAPTSFTWKKAKDLCLAEFACPNKLAECKCQNNAPLYHVLLPKPRLLHFVFDNTLYPKDHSHEVSNEIVLAAIYCLMIGYSVDYASLILYHMYRVARVGRTPSLPYGNLLTRIFQHFEIPLESEECTTQPVPVIYVHSLKTLCFYKTEYQGWQHAFDLSSKEATALEVTLPNTSYVPIVVEVLASLKEDNVALRSQLDQIQLDMCLMNKKIDSLIRLTSLIHHGAQLAIPF